MALDQLNVSTRRYVRSTPKLVDNVFQHDPCIAYLRVNNREDFTGGLEIAENFIYAGLPGGAYLKGAEFDTTERQVEEQAKFSLKFFYANVTLSKEDPQVLNAGPMQLFSLVRSRLDVAYMTIGAHMAIGLYLNGQRAGYTSNFNGLAEAINDNSTNSWDSNTYSTYGGLTRGGKVGTALDGNVTSVTGAIEYNTLEDSYSDASYGANEFEPNLGATTARGYSDIKNKFQTQQRFNDTQDPEIGFNGLKFNSATLTKSRYLPGTFISGTNVAEAVDFLTESSGGVVTAYPTLTSETLFWLNARKPFFNFYVSTNPEYGFGFTGFKPAQGNSKIIGQVVAGVAITLNPRYHSQVYGFTS